MFTFQRAINSEFVPVLKRSDDIEFSMEWIQDMKALGLDAEGEIQNPSATGKPFIKVADKNGIHFSPLKMSPRQTKFSLERE
jgi:hypothetical protein